MSVMDVKMTKTNVAAEDVTVKKTLIDNILQKLWSKGNVLFIPDLEQGIGVETDGDKDKS